MRGRPFPKGRSGNPAGRRFGSRNKATLAAQELLAGEALAGGLITPGEAQAIARVFTTFVQTIETSDFDQRLQDLEARRAEGRSRQPNPWLHSGIST